jgi:hypothetical protein
MYKSREISITYKDTIFVLSSWIINEFLNKFLKTYTDDFFESCNGSGVNFFFMYCFL